MQFINKLKKNQKGFTLVELIVVLVILAILAAFTIPTMLGFVNDAKSKALIAQTRLIYLAASAGVTEYAGSADNAAKGALVDGIYTAADATAVATVTASKTVTGSNSDALATYIKNNVSPDMKDTYQYRVTITAGQIVTVEFSDGSKLLTLKPGGEVIPTDGTIIKK